mmetsp:Transcript_44762/g.83615  ORF Transcript_44762/g.83615 Transcript_44762/m.83615 type:complete len:309 (-) Transcript_44762:246-1172(-)
MVLLREPGRSRLPLRRGCRVLESVVLMVAASLIVLHASLAPQAFVQPQPVSIGSQPKSQLMKGWSSNGLETSPLPERGAPSYVLGIAGFSLLLVYGTLRQKTSRGAQPRVVMAAVPLRVHLDRSVARTVMAEEMVHGPTSPAAKEATSVCAKVSLMHTPTAFCEDVPSLAQEKVTAPKTAIHAVLTTAPQNGNKASPRTARFVGGSRRAATQGQRRSQSSKKTTRHACSVKLTPAPEVAPQAVCFDASRLRLKIQTGLSVRSSVSSQRMRESRTPCANKGTCISTDSRLQEKDLGEHISSTGNIQAIR